MTPGAGATGAVASYAQERRVRSVCALTDRGVTPTAKTVPLACELPERVDPDRLDQAVRAFVGRHPVLAHRFTHRQGRVSLRPVGGRIADLRATVTDGATLPAGTTAVQDFVRAQIDRPFDVVGWPLLRVGVVQGDRPTLYLSADHLVTDGWSARLALREIEVLYRAGGPDPLPAPGDFLRYSAGQRQRYATGPALEAEVTAMQRLLAGRPVQPPFPLDVGPWDLTTGRYVRLALLDTAQVAALGEVCRAARTTLFMAVLAAFGLAVGELTGRPETGVLIATHNRDEPATQSAMGWYANMLPLYFATGDLDRFADALREVRGRLMAVLVHHELPLARVLDSAPAGFYDGTGEQYPTCFVSFIDARSHGPEPAAGWAWTELAPAFRVSYGLWMILRDDGLHAVVASPALRDGDGPLAAFETALTRILRQVAA